MYIYIAVRPQYGTARISSPLSPLNSHYFTLTEAVLAASRGAVGQPYASAAIRS